MSSNCIKLKNNTLQSMSGLEKWLLKSCNCSKCLKEHTDLDKIIYNIMINKHPKISHNNLTLTSKMIIKIQVELAKKHILDNKLTQI